MCYRWNSSTVSKIQCLVCLSNEQRALTDNDDKQAELMIDPELARDKSDDRLIATVTPVAGEDDRNTSPIDYLPDCLLIRIFAFATQRTLALELALVCRRWNEIAMNNAILWHDVEVHTLDPLHIAPLRRFFDRWSTNVRELSFRVRGEPLGSPSFYAVLPRLAALSRLSVAFCEGIDVSIIDFLADQCPQLRSLNVEGAKEVCLAHES